MVELMAFVMITVDDGEDEQQIFDTINLLGVRLTTVELLKNYFFSSEDKRSTSQLGKLYSRPIRGREPTGIRRLRLDD